MYFELCLDCPVTPFADGVTCLCTLLLHYGVLLVCSMIDNYERRSGFLG